MYVFEIFELIVYSLQISEVVKQDAIHEINIKRGITSHFARTLKILQQKHLQCDVDEYIYR